MHEMSLTRNVLDIVLDEANAAGATRVQAVRVTIGDLRDIVEELFEGLFPIWRVGRLPKVPRWR